TGSLSLQAPIKVRIWREWEGEMHSRIIDTTLGRLILNEAVPQDIGFKPRKTLDDMFVLEIDKKAAKKDLGKIVDMCFRKHGAQKTAEVLDAVKKLGYNYSTIAGVTVSVYDILV